MWWFFTLVIFNANARDCDTVSIAKVAAERGPSILVLGERRATQPDLFRLETNAWMHELGTSSIAPRTCVLRWDEDAPQCALWAELRR